MLCKYRYARSNRCFSSNNKQKSFEVAENLKELKQDAKTYDFVIRKQILILQMQKILQKLLKKLT